jgi:hypothetical protein
MDAGTQDLVGFRDLRIGKLREGEGGLHTARTRSPGSKRAFLAEVNPS